MDIYKDDLFKNDLSFENAFWLQILGDHARFIINALPSTEPNLIKKANYFKCLFDELLDKSRKDLPPKDLMELTKAAYNAAEEMRNFKLYIISQQICGKISFNLPPTFVNHMVNELDEYLNVLNCLMNKEKSLFNPIHYHLLWLPDGSGHASSISSSLDMTEKDLIKLSDKFSKTFDNLYLKAIEFKGYMRTGLCEFPALDRLNESADCEMNTFREFLEFLKFNISEKKVLGTLDPLVPDHMYREECYYQTKLSQTSKIKRPDCDPTKPRVKE